MKKGTCKHFNGVSNNCCEAGVRYPLGRSLPCIERFNKAGVVCDKREEPTDAEIAAEQAKVDAFLKDFDTIVQPWVNAKKAAFTKGTSVRSADTCPKCKGIIRYSICGSNGHMMARCETTEGCVNFIE